MFYDTHAHLDDEAFAGDLPDVIDRARVAGIAKIICIGTDLKSSRHAIEISERFDGVYAVVGWHPTHPDTAPGDFRSQLRALAAHPRVVALGETGLDYHRTPAEGVEERKRVQAGLFREHLELAAELNLNCVIHQRDAFEDTLSILEPYATRVRGVFHCFANDTAAMQRILALNSIVSFTGIATFKNGQNVRDVITATPMGNFMLETDSPYLAPVPYRGKRCEPAYVKELSEVVAGVKGCSLDELSRATNETAHGFFSKLR